MSTPRRPRRTTPIKRRAALLTGVLAALAIAGPISGAGAAAPADPCGSQVAVGPTLVDTVFSGPTTIVTSTSPPACVV